MLFSRRTRAATALFVLVAVEVTVGAVVVTVIQFGRPFTCADRNVLILVVVSPDRSLRVTVPPWTYIVLVLETNPVHLYGRFPKFGEAVTRHEGPLLYT